MQRAVDAYFAMAVLPHKRATVPPCRFLAVAEVVEGTRAFRNGKSADQPFLSLHRGYIGIPNSQYKYAARLRQQKWPVLQIVLEPMPEIASTRQSGSLEIEILQFH